MPRVYEPNDREVHLGDGVYAEFDGVNYIWLRVQRQGSQPELVAIEPETMQALLSFAKQFKLFVPAIMRAMEK